MNNIRRNSPSPVRFRTGSSQTSRSADSLRASLREAGPKPHHIDRLKILLPYFADIPIGQINRAVVRDYRKYRHDKKKALSETTINRDLEVLRHLLFWAVEEGYLAANSLSRMPMVRERRKPRAVMSLDEEAQTSLAGGTTPPCGSSSPPSTPACGEGNC